MESAFLLALAAYAKACGAADPYAVAWRAWSDIVLNGPSDQRMTEAADRVMLQRVEELVVAEAEESQG